MPRSTMQFKGKTNRIQHEQVRRITQVNKCVPEPNDLVRDISMGGTSKHSKDDSNSMTLQGKKVRSKSSRSSQGRHAKTGKQASKQC